MKTRYLEEIRPALIDRFGYSSVMQAPKLQKITVNMGVGLAKTDSKVLRAATEQLATIAGQQPSVRRARKSIAAFKLREGNPVGVAVTLRGDRGYEFLDRLVSIAIPRIRDFRGLNPRSFDGRGNYSMGVREQIIFPEIDYDAIDAVRGMDITITTSAASDPEAFALLARIRDAVRHQPPPRGFETLDGSRHGRGRRGAPDPGRPAGAGRRGAAPGRGDRGLPRTPTAPRRAPPPRKSPARRGGRGCRGEPRRRGGDGLPRTRRAAREPGPRPRRMRPRRRRPRHRLRTPSEQQPQADATGGGTHRGRGDRDRRGAGPSRVR